MTMLSQKFVNIKKVRRCFTCDEVFGVGGRMNRQANVDDGCVYSVYRCVDCMDLFEKFSYMFCCPEENTFQQYCVRDVFTHFKVKNSKDLLSAICHYQVMCAIKQIPF